MSSYNISYFHYTKEHKFVSCKEKKDKIKRLQSRKIPLNREKKITMATI